MTLTLSPKQFLRKNLIEGIVNKQMEEDLDFINMFNVTYTDNVSVTYHEDLTTAGEDVTNEVTGEPLDLGELSELTTVEISPITQKAGMLRPFGLQMKVSERDMKRSEIVNDLMRATERISYVMAQKINNDIVTTFKNTTNEITEVGGAAAWSEDTADPIKDIINFKKAFKVSGYGSRLTDLYVHEDNYSELEQYMVGIDRNWAISPRGEEDIPRIRGVSIHEVTNSTEVAEGSYLGFDSRPAYKPMDIYAYRPEGFSVSPNFRMVNVYRYKEQKYPHNEVVEFVGETLYAVKKPNSFCYKSSGI